MSGDVRALVLRTLLPGFIGTELPDWVGALLRQGLGGVCLFGENMRSRNQLRALTDAVRAANPDALIAIDEEGGDVTRLYYDEGSPFPGAAVLGLLDDEERTEAVARRVGQELRRVGCTLDFAPVVDVNSNPDNPVIGVRSFGADAADVARHSAAWVRGLQATGVAASAKHFPGHGDTADDSHLSLPVVDRSVEELAERELLPFAAAIGAGVRTIMTSHILLPQLDPANPATLSGEVLGGLLRGRMGFEGLIVTDALDMAGASGGTGIPHAAVRAIAAGCDLLCIGTGNTASQLAEIVETVERAVASGALTEARLADAAGRVVALARGLPAPDPVVAAPEPDPRQEARGDAALVAAFRAGRSSVTGADRAALAAGFGPRGERPLVLVRVDSHPSLAIGRAPWGPFAELEAEEQAGWSGWSGWSDWSDVPVLAVAEDAPGVPDELSPDARVVVVGRSLHLFPWATATIDELRGSGRDVLVVDMGWPAEDRRYADVATFGASRAVGRALLALLSGEAAA
ncbi:beta-N-acetylhexosaminidase [Planctomonas deserti]|uniref:beta-N-acetylhexosaminidase n=1 Tax=Planctomonas deserti TaxID=2144185 RepID=UPI000D36BFC9|nr:beta-N-acetylhexosaminidase [Planctomonas deserti]